MMPSCDPTQQRTPGTQPEADTLCTLRSVLRTCVGRPALHARLLNTFAYLENIGARKIHRFQRYGVGGDSVLQHAAEEARHAWHFKSQIRRVAPAEAYSGFGLEVMLGGHASQAYLRRLDLAVNRYLQESLGLTGRAQYLAAYLLVTLVIELRASELYPVYASILLAASSPVRVTAVIKDEARHLVATNELLTASLCEFKDAAVATAVAAETRLFASWLRAVSDELAVATGLAGGSRRSADLI